MTLNIEKQIRETPQVGVVPYRQIHAHSTGNARSTAQNEADYMSRKDLNSGFYTHVVGNGRIIQTSKTNKGCWDVGGGWNNETYAAVELIESHQTKEEFMRDYRLYIELLCQLADETGLPRTLDTSDLAGIKTHHYCTYHQPNNFSDHVDPYPYLEKWGISKEQFAQDIQNFGKVEAKKEPVYTIQSYGHVQNFGWIEGEKGIIGTTGQSLRLEAFDLAVYKDGQALTVTGACHIEDVGDVVVNGNIFGTAGEKRRLEAVRIDVDAPLEYRVHVQDIGWQDWTKVGNWAGTKGQSKRIEAIQFRFTK